MLQIIIFIIIIIITILVVEVEVEVVVEVAVAVIIVVVEEAAGAVVGLLYSDFNSCWNFLPVYLFEVFN